MFQFSAPLQNMYFLTNNFSSIEKSEESTSLNGDDSKTETTNQHEKMSMVNESSKSL